MTNLEHFKRNLKSDKLCDVIACYNCPLDRCSPPDLERWCKEEYKKEDK